MSLLFTAAFFFTTPTLRKKLVCLFRECDQKPAQYGLITQNDDLWFILAKQNDIFLENSRPILRLPITYSFQMQQHYMQNKDKH